MVFFQSSDVLLYLFALAIPILVHLFFFRRFQKTYFTNVKLLNVLLTEQKRLRNLKKWLVFLVRFFGIFFLVLGFAHPQLVTDKQVINSKKETILVLYVDNSFSMQAKKDNETLLSAAVQDLLKRLPNKGIVNLVTNNQTYRSLSFEELKSILLNLPFSNRTELSSDQIYLKAKEIAETAPYYLLILSDRNFSSLTDSSKNHIQKHYQTNFSENVSIYAVKVNSNFLKTTNEIEVTLHSNKENISKTLCLYDSNAGDKLIAKSLIEFKDAKVITTSMTIPNDYFSGKLQIEDSGLTYDNTLYLSTNLVEKINVLLVGKPNKFLNSFFEKDEEFSSTYYEASNLDFSIIESHQVLILNEINEFSSPLLAALTKFVENRGILVVIPSNEINHLSYRALIPDIEFGKLINTKKFITKIAFGHPIYKDVFEKKVTRFKYPFLESYYPLKTITNFQSLLSLENGVPFLLNKNQLFVFTSPINVENTDFINHTLVVPTFYKIAISNLTSPKLFFTLDKLTEMQINESISETDFFELRNTITTHRPKQVRFSNKVIINFTDLKNLAGNYNLTNKSGLIEYRLSFNYPRKEQITIVDKLPNKQNFFEDTLEHIKNKDSRGSLWKWFITFALIMFLLELLILKIIK